jgi:hypothetical protein
MHTKDTHIHLIDQLFYQARERARAELAVRALENKGKEGDNGRTRPGPLKTSLPFFSQWRESVADPEACISAARSQPVHVVCTLHEFEGKKCLSGVRSGVDHWSFAQPRSLRPPDTLICLLFCLVNQMWIWRIGCQLGRRGQTLSWISTGAWLSPEISSLPITNLVLRPALRYELFSRRTKEGLVFGEFGWRVLSVILRAWQLCRA